MINRKINIYLQPLSLEVKYEKTLKFQIAIFRMGKEESKDGKRPFKIDKTDPVKYNNPSQKIIFNKTLALMTTIAYNSQTKKYEDKDIDFELALDVDGKKDRIAKKINLNEIALCKTKNQRFSHDTAPIALNCKVFVKFSENQQQNSEITQEPQKKKAKKVSLMLGADQTHREVTRIEKARGKTIFIQSHQNELRSNQLKAQKNKTQIKKCKSHNTMEVVLQKQTSEAEQNCTLNKYKMDSSDLDNQNMSRNQKSTILECQNRELSAQIKETGIKIDQLQQSNKVLLEKHSQLQVKIQIDQKNYKKQKEEYKQTIKNYQGMLVTLKEEVKGYKQEVKKYKSELQFFTSNPEPTTNSNDQEIKQLKQLNSILTKNNDDYYKELMQLQNEIRHKDKQISQYKNKVYELDNENLVLQEKFKSLENKYNKVKNESNEEMIEIAQRINELKEENKSLKIIPSSKDMMREDSTDYRKKCETLYKQVQKKEQLIKKMMQMKKQLQSQKNIQIGSLKKEMSKLKQDIQKLQSSSNGQKNLTIDIQTKIQTQKMKKQLQSLRKNEKNLLMEKNKLQASNRGLQDDLIKNKNSLANIINAVQETQNQKLITEIYNIIE